MFYWFYFWTFDHLNFFVTKLYFTPNYATNQMLKIYTQKKIEGLPSWMMGHKTIVFGYFNSSVNI